VARAALQDRKAGGLLCLQGGAEHGGHSRHVVHVRQVISLRARFVLAV